MRLSFFKFQLASANSLNGLLTLKKGGVNLIPGNRNDRGGRMWLSIHIHSNCAHPRNLPSPVVLQWLSERKVSAGRIDFVFSLSNEVDDFFIIVLSGKSPVHRFTWQGPFFSLSFMYSMR